MILALLLSLSLGQVTLLDEGVSLGPVKRINCVGAGVVCSLYATGSTTGILTISGGGGGGSGTVTSVSVTTANGVSGSVATSTTTPAITLTLGAITPSSVAASGTVTGSNISGTNTGNVTLGAFGSAPAAEGASLSGQALTLQPADSTHPGGISLGNQTFPGVGFTKTFSGQVDHDGILRMNGTNSVQFGGGSTHFVRYAGSVLTGLQLGGDNIELTAVGAGLIRFNNDTVIGNDKTLKLTDGAVTSTIQSNATADRTITLPDATGTLPITPTCGAGEYATGNGTTLSCSTPAGGSGNAIEVEIDFGSGSDTTSLVVTGQTWVTSTSKITCAAALLATADRAEGAEDAVVEGLRVAFHSRVAGTGFTVVAAPQFGRAVGKFKVHCTGG